MTLTSLTSVDNAIPEFWAAALLWDAQKQMFWFSYEGPQGSGMPIIRKDELTKNSAGDTIHVQTLTLLSGAGITSETGDLTGNEEELSLGQITVTVSILAHAVKWTKYANQQALFDIRTTAQNALSIWLSDKMDNKIFTTFASEQTTNILYANDATSVADLGTDDTLSTTTLDKIKVALEMNRAMPIKTSNGDKYFIVVVHPYDAYNLRQDSTWLQVQREAQLRGDSNPIFTGAMGVYNGMIVRISENVANAASKSSCLAFGGEAMVKAYGQLPAWMEQVDDYARKIGIGTDVVYGLKLGPTANSYVVNTYAANPNA